MNDSEDDTEPEPLVTKTSSTTAQPRPRPRPNTTNHLVRTNGHDGRTGMGTTLTIGSTAASKKGMTLQELRDFIAECDQAQMPGSTRLKAQATWGGGLKSLKAGGQEGPDDNG